MLFPFSLELYGCGEVCGFPDLSSLFVFLKEVPKACGLLFLILVFW